MRRAAIRAPRPTLPEEPTVMSRLLAVLHATSTADLSVLSAALEASPSTLARRVKAELRIRRR
jgi:hypothetical protein